MIARVLYKPFGILAGVLGGLLAGAIFKRVWATVAHESEAPEPTEEHRGWREVVLAAAAHGAVYGAVKALMKRGGAAAFARVTGTWPGPKKAV